MPVTTPDLIRDLHKILTTSIANTRLYGARITGFRNELEFARLAAEKNMKILEGGQFLFSKKNRASTPENSLTYITITDDEKNDYVEFYRKLAVLPEIKSLFFIEIGDSERWGTARFRVKDQRGNVIQENIAAPHLTVFEFKEGSWIQSGFDAIKQNLVERRTRVAALKPSDRFSYMSSYNIGEIAGIYCNRYVLDVELSCYNKGMIDLDHVLSDAGSFTLIETKEKDPMKDSDNPSDQTRWEFGWDSRRFGWYLYLKHKLGFDVWYIIREIEDQQSRRFLKWMKTDMDKFCRCASWLSERSGGGGGGTISAPYSAFEKYE
jgi:hypothetical protein